MKIYDATLPVSEETPVYPGDPPTAISRIADIARGDLFTLSSVYMSAHAGTHIDAPYHIHPEGRATDEIPLDVLLGSAFVLPLPALTELTARDLEMASIPPGTRRLLLKTKEGEAGQEDAFLNTDAARWVVDRDIALIGIDTLSVDSPKSRLLESHHILLEAGVVILEGLDLVMLSRGEYLLICLPLKLSDCDGAPARVVLLEGATLGKSPYLDEKGG